MGLAVCPATIVTVSCWKPLTESPTNPSNPTMYGPAGRLLIVTGWPGVAATDVSFVTVRITRPEVNGTPLVGSIRNASAPVPVGDSPSGLLQDRKGSAKATPSVDRRDKIRRAAWRGRGEISVVGVSFKKKKQK